MRLDSETIYRRMSELLESRKHFVSAVITDVKGSCPQRPGARILIHPDGAFEFTIGGGTFEAEVIQDALAAMQAEVPVTHEYKLTKPDLGMYCQGLVKVLFENHVPRPRLLIFGGGHVGQALSRLAASSELFHVSVIDDRKEYADRKKHEQADNVSLTDRAWKKNVPESDPQTYLVIVTRCHATDQILVKRFLDQPSAYMGLIGSRAKIRQFRKELMDDGIAEAALEKLRAPIGLPIGGKDPAEVAISILAEMVRVKNEPHPAVQLSVASKDPRLP